MRSNHISVAGTMAGVVVFALTVLPAARALSPIKITVTESGKTDYAVKQTSEKAKKVGPTFKSARFLAISLRDVSGKKQAGLSVRHYIFATDVAANETVIAGKGEQTTELSAMGFVDLETKTVRLSYQPDHAKASKKHSQQVDAEGLKYRGYVVQVWQAGKLVAEAADPPELRAQVGTAREVTRQKSKKSSSK
jgi:hypothetical protein